LETIVTTMYSHDTVVSFVEFSILLLYIYGVLWRHKNTTMSER